MDKGGLLCMKNKTNRQMLHVEKKCNPNDSQSSSSNGKDNKHSNGENGPIRKD